jgi:mannitol/fructose-specific phosphotransferase system IIA component (Ntr-type)
MDLATLIDHDVVKVPLEAFDKEEAIAELVEVLVRAGKISDRDEAERALFEREAKGSTGIGGGVAIPHAKSEEIEGVAVAVGVSPDGIPFDAADDEPVYLIFLVMAEAHNPGPNVQVLADIGGLMQVPGVYEQMIAAQTPEGLVRAVRNVQVEL